MDNAAILVHNNVFFKFPVYPYFMLIISSPDMQPAKNMIEQVAIMLMILNNLKFKKSHDFLCSLFPKNHTVKGSQKRIG